MAKQAYTSLGEPINATRQPPPNGKITIYNVETGKAAKRYPVDAKGQVASGRWSYEPVTVEAEAEPQAEADSPGYGPKPKTTRARSNAKKRT